MKYIILVVDDDKTNLTLAQKILTPQYRIAATIFPLCNTKKYKILYSFFVSSIFLSCTSIIDCDVFKINC